MSIVRINHNKENPYTLINKTALEDTNLSWGAKGLWSYLISRPDNWNVSVVMLVKTFKKEKRGCGEKAIYKLLNELIEFGYCIREQHKTSKGLFTSYEYIILEHKKLKETLPNPFKGDTEPLAVKRNAVKGDLNNNDLNNIEEEGLNEEEKIFYEKLSENPICNCISNGDKWDAIRTYGIDIVREAFNTLLNNNPKLQKGQNPDKLISPKAVFLSECKKEKKRRDNGKK